MSKQFETSLGLTLTLPDDAEPMVDSSAGPLSRQFSLPSGDVVSLIRDDEAAGDLAGMLVWAQGQAAYYLREYGAVEELQGSLTSPGKQCYAYAATFTDAESVPRRVTLIAILFDDGTFAGITLLCVDLGQGSDLELVQFLVDGLTAGE